MQMNWTSVFSELKGSWLFVFYLNRPLNDTKSSTLSKTNRLQKQQTPFKWWKKLLVTHI